MTRLNKLEILEGWREVAGRIHGPPNYEKCGKRLFGEWNSYQCNNRAKFDPIEPHGRPTRCGVHSSATQKRKDDKEAAARAILAERRRVANIRQKVKLDALEAIKAIAAGHNNARGLALEVLAPLEGLPVEGD